jgi:serine/threonine protein kinase
MTPASIPAPPPAAEPTRFLPGAIIAGRYRVVGLVGRGGMGEVYRADDLKLGQTVALKFLPRDVDRDPDRLQRFLNEVRLALRITHPNVCRVHDIGEIDGQHFISMEYVDGEDLASLLRRIGRLPEERGVEIARQICAGLAAAHEEGILHRDL